MSTVSKTKSRDKKIVNDSLKAPSKASGSIGATTGGAYNLLLGTVESTGSSSLHNSGRFRNMDDSDSNCDSVSNNGSWSGDSEDHREKAPPPTTATTAAKQETIPGAAADNNDKREKMRLKSEKAPASEGEASSGVAWRCCQFLMSRKLEVLVQQATYALMLNEGKIEEAISWLFDGGANVADEKLVPTSGNLKLDISQELGRILELEREYKCTKQDVEKALVTAEGDIEKAEESLRSQKQEQSTASIKAEDVGDNASVSKAASVQASESRVAAQLQLNSGLYTAGGEEDRKSLGYLRGSSYVNGVSGNQRVDRIHTELQWLKMQQIAAMEEKKRLLNLQTRLQRPTEETHYQFRRLEQQEVREPVMVMQQQQRSQSANTNTLPVSTMNSSFTVSAAAAGGSGWYPANRSEAAQSNGYLPTRTLPPSDLNSNLMYQQLQYQRYQGQNAVAPAASLGLFSGYGSTSSSVVDWNTDGSVGYSDYNNIDWSLDRGLASPKPNQAASSSYEANMNGRTRAMGMAMGVVKEAAIVGNGREWTSPFEGQDLFSLSRQYVPPSL
ncbi:hypothetical protein Bca52824_005429 [Brassica carinata]|uniref:UBA domain-containing protein n=1 Tax=Brassica carinata TaxID=52824 RepID=A0A8X7WQQ5_BRACI|nr:hypothetical protein Bca52824_005429 [Brassica carinata]